MPHVTTNGLRWHTSTPVMDPLWKEWLNTWNSDLPLLFLRLKLINWSVSVRPMRTDSFMLKAMAMILDPEAVSADVHVPAVLWFLNGSRIIWETLSLTSSSESLLMTVSTTMARPEAKVKVSLIHSHFFDESINLNFLLVLVILRTLARPNSAQFRTKTLTRL